MKRVIIIFFMASICVAQTKITDPIDRFMSILYENEKYINDRKEITKDFNEKELKELQCLFYNVTKNYSLQLNKRLVEEDQKRDSIYNKTGIVPKGAYSLYYALMEKLFEGESDLFKHLFMFPYIVRIKSLEPNKSEYKIFSTKYPIIIYKVIIEDVIKGSEYLKPGEIISIAYMPLWESIGNVDYSLDENSSYLIPLFNLYEANNIDFFGLGIGDFIDKTETIPESGRFNANYKIITDTIELRSSTLNLGNKLSWQEFKKKFKEKYLYLEDCNKIEN